MGEEIEVIVIAENYVNGCGIIQKYIGDDFTKILKRVIEDHSYSTNLRNQGKLLKHIDENNGDGCDFIFAIFVNKELWFSCDSIETIDINEEDPGNDDYLAKPSDEFKF